MVSLVGLEVYAQQLAVRIAEGGTPADLLESSRRTSFPIVTQRGKTRRLTVVKSGLCRRGGRLER